MKQNVTIGRLWTARSMGFLAGVVLLSGSALAQAPSADAPITGDQLELLRDWAQRHIRHKGAVEIEMRAPAGFVGVKLVGVDFDAGEWYEAGAAGWRLQHADGTADQSTNGRATQYHLETRRMWCGVTDLLPAMAVLDLVSEPPESLHITSDSGMIRLEYTTDILGLCPAAGIDRSVILNNHSVSVALLLDNLGALARRIDKSGDEPPRDSGPITYRPESRPGALVREQSPRGLQISNIVFHDVTPQGFLSPDRLDALSAKGRAIEAEMTAAVQRGEGVEQAAASLPPELAKRISAPRPEPPAPLASAPDPFAADIARYSRITILAGVIVLVIGVYAWFRRRAS